MIRVHVICEGQTEEMFLNEMLSVSMGAHGVYLHPTLIGKPGHKGGRINLDRLHTDIRMRLLGDTSAYCTTLFDYYGLPDDFPGKEDASSKGTCAEKATCVEMALTTALSAKLGEDPLRRFIPYVQMHEFEGLLFSAPEAFATGIGKPGYCSSFRRIRNEFPTPEDINDSQETAPSKRILKLLPDYEKPIQGTIGAMSVGLPAMRHECPLFDAWLTKMGSLRPLGSPRP